MACTSQLINELDIDYIGVSVSWVLAMLQMPKYSVKVHRKVKLHVRLVISICVWFAVQCLLLELMAKFHIGAAVCCNSFTMTCLSCLG